MLQQLKLAGAEYISVPVAEGDNLETRPLLFVSPGEYPIYDLEEYDFMQEDKITEEEYIAALKQCVRGKHVLDIGTGRDMDWGMFSIDLWAKSATGVEAITETYEIAKKNLENHEYNKYFNLVNSWSTKWTPDKLYEICVSEIIGTIGGSEGAAASIKDAKERLLKPDAKIIPYSCITKVAGFCLRDYMPKLEFHPEAVRYIERIFDLAGHSFDLRLTLTIPPKEEDLITTHGVMETLNFEDDLRIEDEEVSFLEVTKKGNIDGLLLWINLLTHKEGKVIDSLNQQTAWEVVYIPLFDSPYPLEIGDQVNILATRELSKNKINPNYFFNVAILDKFGNSQLEEEFRSPHLGSDFHSKQIYKELFKLT